MDTIDTIASMLDVKEYNAEKTVPRDVKTKILEAGRLTGSGMNAQHWRFVAVQKREDLKKLAEDSTTGKWVEQCNFAVIILTDPKLAFHTIDAGRAVQDMKLAAWNFGVASRLFTGMSADKVRKDFGIPEEMNPTIVVGFGYPKKRISGKRKKRTPLSEVAFVDKYGNKFEHSKLAG